MKEYKVVFSGGAFKLQEKDKSGALLREANLNLPNEMFSVKIHEGVPHVMDGEEKIKACADLLPPANDASSTSAANAAGLLTFNFSPKG